VLPDTQIADSHLAQRAVEIGEHPIEKALRQEARLRPFGFQAVQVEKGVQASQLKAPVNGIRHTIVGKEDDSPRLLDYAPIGPVGSIAGGIVFGS
jgi:hypothetical protein